MDGRRRAEEEKNGRGREEEAVGSPRGLTACEYGLTSSVRLQVFSTGLVKTKIKPRNVNLFSIVDGEKRDKECIHTYQIRLEQN